MQQGSGRYPRPKGKTPAEAGAEFAAKQRQLKQEAADRRSASAAPEGRADASNGGRADEVRAEGS